MRKCSRWALNTMRCAMCHQKDPHFLSPLSPNDPWVNALPPIDTLSSITQRPPVSDLSPKDPHFLILSPKDPHFLILSPKNPSF